MNFLTNDEKTEQSIALQFGTFQEKLPLKEILKGLVSCLHEDREYWLDKLIHKLHESDNLSSEWTLRLNAVVLEANEAQSRKLAKLFRLLNDKINEKKSFEKRRNSLNDGMVHILLLITRQDCKDDEEILTHRTVMLQSIVEHAPHNLMSHQKTVFKFLFRHMDVSTSSAQDAIANCLSKLPLMCKKHDEEKAWNEYLSCTIFFLETLIKSLLGEVDRSSLHDTVKFDVQLPVEEKNASDFKLLRLVQTLTKCGMMLLKNMHGSISEPIILDFYTDCSNKVFKELNQRVMRKRMKISLKQLTVIYSSISALVETFIWNFAENYAMSNATMYVSDALQFIDACQFDIDIFSAYQKMLFRVLYALFQRCQKHAVLKVLENSKTQFIERLCSSIEIVGDPKTTFFEVTKHEEVKYALRIILLILKLFQYDDRDNIVKKEKLIQGIVTVTRNVQTEYKQKKLFPASYKNKDCRKLLYECLFRIMLNYDFASALDLLKYMQLILHRGMNDPDDEVRKFCKDSIVNVRPSLPLEQLFSEPKKHVFSLPTYRLEDLKIWRSQVKESLKTYAPRSNLTELQNGSVDVSNTANSIANGKHCENPTEFSSDMANSTAEERQEISSAKEDDGDAFQQDEEMDDIQEIDMEVQVVSLHSEHRYASNTNNLILNGNTANTAVEEQQESNNENEDYLQQGVETDEVQEIEMEEQLVNLDEIHRYASSTSGSIREESHDANQPQFYYNMPNLCVENQQEISHEEVADSQQKTEVSEIQDLTKEQLVYFDSEHTYGSSSQANPILDEFRISTLVEKQQKICHNIEDDDNLPKAAEINKLNEWLMEKLANSDPTHTS